MCVGTEGCSVQSKGVDRDPRGVLRMRTDAGEWNLLCEYDGNEREGISMSGIERNRIRPGVEVQIVQKQHQRMGQLTRGVVQDILTKSPTHPHGIKVRLETGEVGRVKEILSEK